MTTQRWTEPFNDPNRIEVGKAYGPWTVLADDGLHCGVRFWKVRHRDNSETSKTAKYLDMAAKGLTDPQGLAPGKADPMGRNVPRSSLPTRRSRK